MLPQTTSGALAQILNAELVGSPDVTVSSLGTVDDGTPGALTFIRDQNYSHKWAASGASVAITSKSAATDECRAATGPGRALLIVPNADLALVMLLEKLAPAPNRPAPGIHPSSVIDPAARIDPSAAVGPLCHVGAGSVVGPGAVLRERVSIAEDCTVGAGSELYPGVVLYPRTVVGQRVILHAGVVLGADGFGYRPASDGRGVVKIPHIGNVVIEDDVEIGANSCVDRAKFGSTRIGAGSKIDNLVQIGHGVTVGRSAVLCAQVGIAGSATVGDGASLGGQVGVADGIDIGAMAKIGAQSGLDMDVPPKATIFGTPGRDFRMAFAEFAFVSRLYRNRARIMKWLKQSAD